MYVMDHRVAFIFLVVFFILIPKINSEVSFKDAIINPLHETPSFSPRTYNQEGYTELMHTLIRWEMTRSMYDDRFSGATDQIKILSNITNSSYGLAMFHYLEGIRKGLTDPFNAENDFLKALEYFKAQQDTSGILHTTMHLFRVNLNTTMAEFGDLKRYITLYEEVILIGAKAPELFDQIIHGRIKLLYYEFMYGFKTVDFYKETIDKGLSLVDRMPKKYDYYKYLMLNAIGIVHSKNIKTIEAEKFHIQSYEYIKKYSSKEHDKTIYRIAMMQYINKKYNDAKNTFSKKKNHTYNYRLLPNFELNANSARLSTLLSFKKGNIIEAEKNYEIANAVFVNDFLKKRHILYAQNIAALYKIEENNKKIRENEKKEFRQQLTIIASITLLLLLVIFLYQRAQKQKKLEKEIKQKNFIYSMIGHDLSSPMVGMDMILDQIYTDLQNVLNDKQKNYLNQLRSNAQGGNLLLNNLLNLYKQETGFSTNHHHYTPIQIKNEINIATSHLFNNKIGTFITIENRCPEHIVQAIDSPSFQCVIRNIVDNALKHSKCDTIILNAELNQNNLIVTITNNGIELPKGILEIFNQDKSILESSLSKTKIGLGTIFIIEFVKALKSKLKVHTSENETKFIWSIPVR
jgi:signal transduction histidine kinase